MLSTETPPNITKLPQASKATADPFRDQWGRRLIPGFASLPAPRPGPALTECTQTPQPASASPLYKGFAIHLVPCGQRWTALIELPHGDHYTGVVRDTRDGAIADAHREIDRIEAQKVDPAAMPGSVAMSDAIADGRVR